MMSRLTVFDLDHTLIQANSSFKFGSYLYKNGFFSFFSLLQSVFHYSRYKFLGLPIEQLHFRIFDSLFKGRSREQVEAYAFHFIKQSLPALLYSPAVERLRNAQSRGDTLLILSSSPHFLVGLVANGLGVENWEATSYQSDEKGNLARVGCVLEGEQKAERLRIWAKKVGASRAEITVYSDSHWDLPLLFEAGQAVAVKPDRKLRKVCRKESWEII